MASTADRRAEILDAAVKVFSEAGFHGGSLREIAERVGLSQPGLLHHFANKEHLLEAVLTYRDDQARERMGPEPPTGVALLDALIDLAAYNATTPAWSPSSRCSPARPPRRTGVRANPPHASMTGGGEEGAR